LADDVIVAASLPLSSRQLTALWQRYVSTAHLNQQKKNSGQIIHLPAKQWDFSDDILEAFVGILEVGIFDRNENLEENYWNRYGRRI